MILLLLSAPVPILDSIAVVEYDALFIENLSQMLTKSGLKSLEAYRLKARSDKIISRRIHGYRKPELHMSSVPRILPILSDESFLREEF